jgi:hypothetical protein
MGGGLFQAGLQAKRRCRGLTPEADIGNEQAICQINQRKAVARRAASRCHSNHPATECTDRKSESRQYVVEKSIVLVAITATTPLHELGLDCFRVDFDRSAKKRIQPLKCDPTGVASVQILQHRKVGSLGPS